MKNHPKLIGERSEAQVIATLLRAGIVVLTPFGDSQRYDMVIDHDGTFIRIQCKTGRVVAGAVKFNCCSNNWNTRVRKTYHGQADIFAVYSPELERIFMVPVSVTGKKSISLRLSPPKNGQQKAIRMAADYEFNGTIPSFD